MSRAISNISAGIPGSIHNGKLWQEIGQLYAPAGNKPSATC
jgi:hypothetical protein